ncbi:MAG TPA: hypothetical protein HA348_06840 [Thermoplasmata archaeon]|nr:hypothetical protein [Thermoplasmata archaeon]
MFNVCLMGASLDTGNMGVSALSASLIKLIKEARPDASFYFFIGNKSNHSQKLNILDKEIEIKIANYRLSPRSKIKEHLFWILILAFFQRITPFQFIKNSIINSTPCLKTLKYSDFIGDIHGGDSFSDIYSLQRMILGTIPQLIVLLLGKELVLLPQTYGPFKSAPAKRIAHFVISKSSIILSRDRQSIEVIKNILGKKGANKKIILCPDVAFALDLIIPQKINIIPSIDKPHDVALIGFNINGLLYNGGYSKNNMFSLKYDYKLFAQKLAESLLEKTNAHLLLVPHTFAPAGNVESDNEACREIYEFLQKSFTGRVHFVAGIYNQFNIKGIIGFCDFFIGSRMHSCIAALSQGIPTVGVAYSRKFKGIFDSINVGNMVSDARSASMEETIDFILNQFNNKQSIQADLRNKVRITRKRQIKIFDLMMTRAHPQHLNSL